MQSALQEKLSVALEELQKICDDERRASSNV